MFEGKFYNGHTSQGMPAAIHLAAHGIIISYQAGEESGTVFWELAGIEQSEFNDATTLLRYGGYPQQQIAVFEQDFMQALQRHYPEAAFLKSRYRAWLRTGLAGMVVAGGLLLLLAVTVFFWGVPALADQAAAHFPEDFERRLGEELHTTLLQEYEIDSAKTAALKAYLNALQVQADFPIEVTVVKEQEVNAFAVPGGFVVVHEGILKEMQGHEELAALLGHEIGHVQLRHSTKAIARSLSYYMLFSLLLGDISGVAAVIVDNAAAFKDLEYSRSAEQDADRAGLELLLSNKLNPAGMLHLMERLQAQEGDEMEALEFMSTHPSTQNRIVEIRQQIKETSYTIAPNPALEAAWKKLKQRE